MKFSICFSNCLRQNNFQFSKIFFLFVLVSIILILFSQNYRPGTYLSGWDTLHPEFDFSLYFKRTFFGVWQEHQGLGAVAAQSHAGDLPRLLLYYPLSLLLPMESLRWAYLFLSLLLGPLGVYFLLKQLTGKPWICYCSGLLYLLNLGTLQHFYLPLEMFITHYAGLPWLFLFAVRFLRLRYRSDLMLFSLVTLLSAPISHTPTLFYVYLLALALFLTANIIVDRSRLSRCLLILFVTLIINSFWLLPNVYFILNHGREVVSSKIHNQLFYRAFYTSREFATLQDVSLIRGYLFDWGRFDLSQRSFVDLFGQWKIHLNNPLVKIAGYLTFLGVILGITVSFLKKNKEFLVFLPVFGLPFLALTADLTILSSVSILREALRFHFTKFSILLMFSFSIYFGLFLECIGFKLAKVIRSGAGEAILASALTAALIFFMLPAFGGNFIGDKEKVSIPPEYFQAFKFLNDQKAARIADFPIHTFWAWTYYDWDYEGAGFLWFGLKSPLLNREFDRWSAFNENYYWEISYALYSKNLKLLEVVLDKYQVGWLWVDGYVFSPSSPKSLYLDELENLLSVSAKVSPQARFGKIKIYKVNLDAPVDNFVFLAKSLPLVGPDYKWTNFDRAYLENSNYISTINHKPQTINLYYPFRSLFTGRTQADLEFTVEERAEDFVFRKVLPKEAGDYFLEIPAAEDNDLEWIDPADPGKIKDLSKNVFFDGKVLEVTVPKVKKFTSFADRQGRPFATEIDPGAATEFLLPDLPHSLAYLITVDSRNLSGKPFNFWLENLNSRRADMETYLPALPDSRSIFIQPPMEQDGLGYTAHFDQVSFGGDRYENKLDKIKIYPIPFRFLTGLKLTAGKPNVLPEFTAASVSHPNPSLYLVNIPEGIGDNSTLVLSQSFDSGWKAYEINFQFPIFNFQLDTWLPFVFGQEIKDHVMVNNWENGWLIPGESKQIVVVYLPQYLEYLGILLLISYISYVGFLLLSRKMSG